MNELARKDLFTCLGAWLALELVCFGLLPGIGLNRSNVNIEPWFIASIPLGIGGAFLLASSTHFLEGDRPETWWQKRLTQVSAVLVSWAGLLGISFPLLVMSLLIFIELFAQLRGS
ncbi:hypothetical protein [Thermocoleostomius sinensis]|jgi:hypothetical protein|uniref:Uncharacterized protein n=1 Tax=Thermocoleostomius sinensis A174 TaxID=2016057 RepID=A0A9E8ZBW9_9CYAN|nr:hypothetical protein [Thermocoleostomius sinensis]WAL60313.1 hypothetical protein OXH18_24635 [Thermocoleostomius sinensis A174]